MKVYELAKKHSITTKDLIKALEDLGVQVDNHLSKLASREVTLFEESLQQKKQKQKRKPTKAQQETKKEPAETPAPSSDVVIVHRTKVQHKTAPQESDTGAEDDAAKAIADALDVSVGDLA